MAASHSDQQVELDKIISIVCLQLEKDERHDLAVKLVNRHAERESPIQTWNRPGAKKPSNG